MESKKKPNVVFVIFVMFFLGFILLYFTAVTDIYQYHQYNRMAITKESMERFEKDVESGKDITISDYLDTVKDYSNGMSNLGYKTSNMVNEFMDVGIKRVFKVFASLFT